MELMASSSLPLDVIFNEILPRVPVKSLLRFKSVSKSWYALISDPKFRLSTLRRRIMVTDYVEGPISLTNVSGTHKLSTPSSAPREEGRMWESPNSCEDLLCIEGRQQIYIWNPTTRQTADLRCDRQRQKRVIGFGRIASSTGGSFKILFLMEDTPRSPFSLLDLDAQRSTANFYVLGGGRAAPYKVSRPPLPIYCHNATVDGIVYVSPQVFPATCILRFDLQKEEWLPGLALPPKLKINPSIYNLNGSLCLVGQTNFIWIFKDCKWVEHVVPFPVPFPAAIWRSSLVKPMSVMKDGRIMIGYIEEPFPRFFVYDPKGRTEVQEVTQDHHRELRVSTRWSSFNSVTYIEGLTSPDILLGTSSSKRRPQGELLPCSSAHKRSKLV